MLLLKFQELRELTKLKKEGHDASFIVRKEELDLGMTESSKAELKGASGRPKTRMDKLLQDSAALDENCSGEYPFSRHLYTVQYCLKNKHLSRID